MPGGYRAYVPDPLPPPLAWDAALAGQLSAADLAVGKLAGEGRRLLNPHLLIRPFVRREAVLSSKIEGTQATLGELRRRGHVIEEVARPNPEWGPVSMIRVDPSGVTAAADPRVDTTSAVLMS